MISIHPEGTFGRLRYSLGGDRPSQTPHLALFPTLLSGVRPKISEEWYFTVASEPPKSGSSQAPTYPTHHRPRPNAKLE